MSEEKKEPSSEELQKAAEDFYRQRMETKLKEKRDNPVQATSNAVHNGMCLFCKAVVTRENVVCTQCGAPVNDLNFSVRFIEHNVKYQEFEDPTDNFVITKISGGRIVREKNQSVFVE